MRSLFQFFVALMLGFASLTPAFADGGGGGGGDFCRVLVGDFTLMFSAYQPQLTGDRKYCTQLPGLGRTNLVFDYESKEGTTSVGATRALDQKIKEMKLTFKVVRESDGTVIAEVPPKKMRGGIVETVVDFEQPGNYEVEVKLVDPNGKEYENHLELLVGVDSGSQMRLYMIVGVVLLALVYILYLSHAGFRAKVDVVLGKFKNF
ncbi:hypothetical protein MIT9_P1678 [Methylomarinovum caldicuralii]|uniref:Uncharacterized protein n=1 Tax=Methylomarinovum caldicuralii TaxID=438856 RepID=A0AAU9C7R1_9GAMM|nr:hypothetical protein [Methylomarinovum caldicuralii]BCX82094.1 hypothetical protein MIT9_P1678 [Methylomarinovum caldicuralii]